MRKSLHLEMDLTLEPRFTKEFVVKKNDDITLDIVLKNNKLPVVADNQVARLFVRKQDGSVIVQGGTEELGDGSIVIGGNVVRIHLKNSATNTTGLCYAELELQDDSGVMATHSFIFEVIDRLDNIDEAIKATDDIYILKELEEFIIQAKKDIAEIREVLNQMRADMEQAVEDFNNAVKDFEEKLEETNTDIDEKVAHFEELIAGLEGRIEDFENAYKNVGEELALLKEEAIVEIDNLRKWSINNLEDRHGLYQESLAQAYTNYSRKIKEQATLSKLEIQRAGEEIVVELDTVKNNAVTEMTNLHTQYMIALDEKFESSIGEIEEKMGQALRYISDATESSLEAIQDKADDIMEQIENIEAGSIEGVEEAVRQAQKRLQEQAIQSTWDVQQAGKEEEERLQASLGQKASELKDGLEATTDAYLEEINQAGQEIVEIVENLEANIEQGLTTIQNTINTGKAEIKDLSDSYLNRIEAEGEEIVQAVRDLEITTNDNIERINQAGLSARQSIESKANSEINQINSTASNRRQEINELVENKLEVIENAGDSKLEEIEGILGVTKGEAEELLEQARIELNTGKAQISSSINEGLTNISNLKSTSISEMTTKKEELVEEILSAEIDMKNDFKDLADEYTNSINELGSLKVENLQNMIKSIDDLEEAVANNLRNSQERAENIRENFDNIFESTDNKMDEIRPFLDSLEEMRNICISLQQENAEANENIQELEYLHIEADTRIVELRRLIEEVKNLELELQAYIDAKGGNHDEILLRLDALEESVIALDDTIAQLGNIYATIKDLEANYSTKKELKTAIEDAMKNTGLRVVGKIGAGIKLATDAMPDVLKNLKTPEHLIDTYGEVKHSYIYQYRPTNGSVTYYKIIFFCDLDNPKNEGKYVSFKDGVFTFNGLEKGKDYAVAYTTSKFSEDPFNMTGNLTTITNNSNEAYSYYMDFNLYNETGEEILVNNPKKAGVSNLNNATDNGFYILDMNMTDYKELSNAPTLQGSIAKGYLEVVGNTQKLTIVDGQVFTRETGGIWSRIDNNAISKNTVATIGKSTAIKAPDLFKTAPVNLKAFHRYKEKVVMFRKNETDYCVLRVNSYYDYDMSCNNTKFIVPGGLTQDSVLYTYNTNNETWSVQYTLGSSSLYSYEISINNAYFEVYHSDYNITHTVHSIFSIPKTTINYDVKETIKDFNSATEVGYYDVNIEGVADGVINSPVEAIKGILKVERNDDVIYQELKANNNMTIFKRVFNGSWSSWSSVGEDYIGTVGLSLKSSVDKKNIFTDIPNAPVIKGAEYIGKFMYSYIYSSKMRYVCIYMYKSVLDNLVPYVSATINSNANGEYANITGYDMNSNNTVTYYKSEGETTWTKTYGSYSLYDYYNSHIYHNDTPIYTGGKDKTGIYREAMNADVIGDLDRCAKAGKYYVNIKKDEYNQIGNIPPVKVEKDVETTLYVNTEGEKTLQEITIEGITYTRRLGESWTGINNSFVKNNVIANIEGVEVNATDYEIETANIEDIYASCPVPNNHKTPAGTIDFKDSSGRYYRWFIYGKNSGFFFSSNNYIGCYAYNISMTERYTYNGSAWVENTITSASGFYVSVGKDGAILACDIDVVGGTSYNAIDKTTIVRKADKEDSIKVINDFNEATTEGRYKVNIEENKEVLNAPIAGVLSGTLEVIKVDSITKQVLTIKDNVFTRTFSEEWSEWFSSKVEEAEEIGKVEISPKYEWDIVPDKTIYNNLVVPNNCKSIWAGKLNGYFIVAFFNREIEMEVIKANDKEYMKVRDYKYADVIGSYYYNTSARGWTKEGESSCNHYYNGNTSSSYSLTATFYNNYVMYNEDGTIYKPSYLDKDVVLGIEDLNEAIELNTYAVKQENEVIANSPIEEPFEGILKVEKYDSIIYQTLKIDEKEYKRFFKNEEWSEWTTNAGGLDEETSNKINDLLIPNNEKINTINITNGDGMPESYSWIDMNGFKVMWIDVKLSEEEYNLGASGLMMKTLNIPEEAQVFSNIINANITSYCRASNDTLSRIVQNAEVISNTSVRGRWRHTDNTYPRIDRFTIICFGF